MATHGRVNKRCLFRQLHIGRLACVNRNGFLNNVFGHAPIESAFPASVRCGSTVALTDRTLKTNDAERANMENRIYVYGTSTQISFVHRPALSYYMLKHTIMELQLDQLPQCHRLAR